MSSRIERIRNCRSTNDIRKVIAEIATSTERIMKSLSSLKLRTTYEGRSKLKVSLNAIEGRVKGTLEGNVPLHKVTGPGSAITTVKHLDPDDYKRNSIKLDLVEQHT